MPLLAVDTALDACSVAVAAGPALLAARRTVIGRGHAEALPAMVAAVMAAAGLGHRDLGRLAVTIGPGSFTGLRVGLAFVRGLAHGLGLPVTGVGTLAALAAAVPPDDTPILAAIDARRDELYVQPFAADGRELAPPRLGGRAEIGRMPGIWRVVGSGAGPLAALDPRRFHPAAAAPDPDAVVVARLARREPAPPPGTPPPPPLYLRAPHVTMPHGG